MNFKDFKTKLSGIFGKNKYLIALFVLGVLLMLLPSFRQTKTTAEKTQSESFSLAKEEERMADALSEIAGAGRVRVVLTLCRGTETVIAYDRKSSQESSDGENRTDSTQSAVITGSGSSEAPVALLEIYPDYTGALAIAEGADNAAVARKLTEAVHSLTGLGRDKITVVKMK